VFIDADPEFWQMDPSRLADFLDRGCERRNGALVNRTTGRRVRAIMPVHVLGHPVDMDSVLELARRHALPVIEDATESLGARYHDRAVGHLGDVACFSFNGNKLITTGGGGMLVTDNEEFARRARYLTTQAKDDPIEYEHHEVGYNYRLTNVLAAMGVAQMEQLDEFVEAKRRIAACYADALRDVPGITTMKEAPWADSAFWMYTVLVDEAQFGMDSRALLRALGGHGIQSRPLWQPMHRSPAHAGSPPAHCPVADGLNRDALSLPCSVGLRESEQQVVIARIRALAAR
jgi:perosamine synthetase